MSRFSFTLKGLLSDESHTHIISYGFDRLPTPGYFYQVLDEHEEKVLVDWDTRKDLIIALAPWGGLVHRTQIANTLEMWADMLEGKYANDDTIAKLRKHALEIVSDLELSE